MAGLLQLSGTASHKDPLGLTISLSTRCVQLCARCMKHAGFSILYEFIASPNKKKGYSGENSQAYFKRLQDLFQKFSNNQAMLRGLQDTTGDTQRLRTSSSRF